MNQQQRHRLILILAVAGLCVAGLSAAAVAAGIVGGDSRGLRPQDVVDAETGRAYLTQTIRSYLADPEAKAVGVFEFLRAPIGDVRDLQRALGVFDTGWEASTASTAIVLIWSSPDASFSAPRARPGIDARLAGDAFVILLEPATGLEARSVVPSDTLDPLRRAGMDSVEAEMVLP